MTKVTYILVDDLVKEVTVKGHSGYGHSGYDIVCASISTLTQYSLNLIYEFGEVSKIKYEIKDAFVKIEVIDSSNTIEKILTTMLKELEELTNEFPKNIKINCRRLAQ